MSTMNATRRSGHHERASVGEKMGVGGVRSPPPPPPKTRARGGQETPKKLVPKRDETTHDT